MNADQLAAIYLAAVDLAHAIKAQRDCEPMDEKSLLFTLQDLREAFPMLSDQIAVILEDIGEVQS